MHCPSISIKEIPDVYSNLFYFVYRMYQTDNHSRLCMFYFFKHEQLHVYFWDNILRWGSCPQPRLLMHAARTSLICLSLSGKKPIESKGTRVVMMLSDVDTPREWGAKVVKMDGSDVTVRIFTPPNCIVSKWTFKFDTILKKEEGSKVFRYTHAHPIYLLFNPWCPGMAHSYVVHHSLTSDKRLVSFLSFLSRSSHSPVVTPLCPGMGHSYVIMTKVRSHFSVFYQEVVIYQ